MDLAELISQAKKKGFELRSNDSRDISVLKEFLNGAQSESSEGEIEEEESD